MSNLSDLLPAGASAKQLTFTDSGSGIATKKPVILNSDGTVTEVSESTVAESVPYSTATAYTSAAANYNSISYNPADSTRFVVGYSSSGCQLIVGTVTPSGGSAATIAYSTPVTVTSNSVNFVRVKFQPNTNKLVVIYQDDTGSKLGYAVLYNLSGTTLTLEDTETFDPNGNSGYIDLDYSTETAGLLVISYVPNNASNYPRARTGLISGTTLTLGTEYVVNSTSGGYTAVSFLYNSAKFAYNWKNFSSSPSGEGKSVIGTVAGDNSTISFGSIQEWRDSTGQGPTGIDSEANPTTADSFAIQFTDAYNSYYESVVACSVSGTTITFGTITALTNWGNNNRGRIVASGTNSFISTYDGAYTGSYPQYGLFSRPFTISGVAITLGTQVTFAATFPSGYGAQWMGVGMKPDSGEWAVAFKYPTTTYGNVWLGRIAYTSTTLTATNFVGIADSAISASAAGSVIVQGGTISGLSSLTTGSSYYVQADGTFGTSASTPSVKAGLAISTTSLLLNGDS